MLYLIGIGLNSKQITKEAEEAIKESDITYLESYTSKYSEGTINELEKEYNKKIEILNREKVEQEITEKIIEMKEKKISLLIFGNGVTATTHISLIRELEQNRIEVKIIPGISIMNYLGITGLDEYKFGRTITIVEPQENYFPKTYYQEILKNKTNGLHTLCLLDIKMEQNKLMDVEEAIEILEIIEKENKIKNQEENKTKKKTENKTANRTESKIENIPEDEMEIIALLGMGNQSQKIIYGNKNEIKKEIQKMKEKNTLLYPQSMIIIGKLNENEKEFIQKYKINNQNK